MVQASDFGTFNLGQIMEREQLMRARQTEMDRQAAEDKRAEGSRMALGDYLTAAPGDREAAYGNLARTDPATAQSARRSQLEDAGRQLTVIGQLAGSATDQPTYSAALEQAQRMGLDVSHLPQVFDANTVETIRRQAMTAAQQVTAELQQMRLENDIADDETDNERADLSLGSLMEYRDRRLEQIDEAEEGRNSRFDVGQGRLDRRTEFQQTQQNRRTEFQQRQANRRTEFSQQQQNRRSGRGGRQGAGRPAPQEGAIIRNPRTGQRMRLQGGRWVPVGG